jgi:outer membrane biosynthesis protein TonB
VPDRRSIFRLLALAGFLLTVALALWLAEVRPLLVVVVMAIALLVAWTVEWLSWHQDLARLAVEAVDAREGEAAIPLVPPPLAAPDPEPDRAEPEAVPELVSSSPVEPDRDPAAAHTEPTAVEPEPEPAVAEPVPTAQPEPEPQLDAEPEPEPAQPALRPVPAPAAPRPARPATQPQPVRPAAPSRDVIDLRTRVTAQPRRWNLWDLERRARDEAQRDPLRYEEWSFLFVHLRQFASPDGSLPTEFDGLVRESFGELLEHAS